MFFTWPRFQQGDNPVAAVPYTIFGSPDLIGFDFFRRWSDILRVYHPAGFQFLVHWSRLDRCSARVSQSKRSQQKSSD
jgi:hypothetical protein